MAIPNSPCHKCGKRMVGCHSECLEYSIYKIDMAQYNAVIKDAKDKEKAMYEYDLKHKLKGRHK
jgi:hypothetical protein